MCRAPLKISLLSGLPVEILQLQLQLQTNPKLLYAPPSIVLRVFLLVFLYSIGYAIARRLGLDGASVMISSRRQQNVQQAVEKLKEENCNVAGVVCHVGKQEDRTQLIQEVGVIMIMICRLPTIQ